MSSSIRVQRICQFCNIEFTAQTTVTRFCSPRCNSRNSKLKIKNAKIAASNQEIAVIKLQPITLLKEKEFLSIEETGILLGVSKRTLYRLIEKNIITIGKFGRRTIIKRSEIDRFFEQ